jgi:hypothetical protein
MAPVQNGVVVEGADERRDLRQLDEVAHPA